MKKTTVESFPFSWGKLFFCFFLFFAKLGFCTEFFDSQEESKKYPSVDSTYSVIGEIYVQKGAILFKAGKALVSGKIISGYHETSKTETGIRKKKISKLFLKGKENPDKETTGIKAKPTQYVKPSAEDSSVFSASSISRRSFIVLSTNTTQQKYIHNQVLTYNAPVFVWYMLIVFSFYKSCRILFFLRGQLFQRPPPASLFLFTRL